MEASNSGTRARFAMIYGALIFSVPVLATIVPHGASVPFFFLWMPALLLLPVLLKSVRLDKRERVLLWVFFAYFAFALASWAGTGFSDEGLKHVGRAARFAVVIPVYLMVRYLKPGFNWIAYGLILGAIATGSWAIVDRITNFYTLYGMRASGATHPILFGNLSLIMGVMSLAMWPAKVSGLFRALLVLALLMGLAGSLFSASRGGWIAIPVLALFMLWYHWHSLNGYLRTALLASMIVLPVVLYHLPATGVKQRVSEAVDDIDRYSQGDSMNNSIGERLAMWEAGWIIFLDRPLTGAGVGNFIDEAQQLMEREQVGEFNELHYHAHSMYVTILAQQGIIGFAALLAVLLYPFYMFARHIRSHSGETRALALAGICLILGYMHFGVSEAVFTRSLTTIFYVFIVIVSLAMIPVISANSRE